MPILGIFDQHKLTKNVLNNKLRLQLGSVHHLKFEFSDPLRHLPHTNPPSQDDFGKKIACRIKELIP